jgi:nuclear cap-binding protein subunit 2
MLPQLQNKKRKYDREEEIGRERTPEEPAEDPLKDATTLYVGNL